MNTPDPTLLLWVGSNLLVVGAALLSRIQLAYRQLNQVRQQQQQELGELRRICDYVKGHMPPLEKRLEEVSNRQDQLEVNGPDGRPFHNAIRMVRHGAGADRIIENCGLTPGEAELVVRLHGVPVGNS